MIDTLISQTVLQVVREREAFIMKGLKDYFGTLSLEELKLRVEIHAYPSYEEWIDKANKAVIMRINKPEIMKGGQDVKFCH